MINGLHKTMSSEINKCVVIVKQINDYLQRFPPFSVNQDLQVDKLENFNDFLHQSLGGTNCWFRSFNQPMIP